MENVLIKYPQNALWNIRLALLEWGPQFKDYDAVCFSYGYTKRQMLWECKGITIGKGRPEWGAPDHETFIIKLGNRLNDERSQ